MQIASAQSTRLPAIALVFAVAACSPSYERTGQKVVFDRPGLQVAVVQTYQSLPLHYYGLRHVLACRSSETRHALAVVSDGLDAGWIRVGDLPGVPGQSPSRETRARGLADAVGESRRALVIGDGWIAWRGHLLRVSTDACARFAEFIPWRDLPAEIIRRRPKPDFCTAQMDCRHLEFDDEGRSRFEDVRAERIDDGKGWRISATLHSPGLLDGLPRNIVTTDGGRNWRVEPLRR